eukprot:6999372-Prymnesium_polylepis.1
MRGRACQSVHEDVRNCTLHAYVGVRRSGIRDDMSLCRETCRAAEGQIADRALDACGANRELAATCPRSKVEARGAASTASTPRRGSCVVRRVAPGSPRAATHWAATRRFPTSTE